MPEIVFRFVGNERDAARAAQIVRKELQGVQTETKNVATTARTTTQTIKQQAQAEIGVRLKEREALEKLAREYRDVANAAQRGSREQVTAARLAADANRKLASATSTTTREQRQLDRATANATRSMGRASRGALAGSGAFGGFGRSIAFASGSFLGAAGFIHVVGQSVSAASNLAEQTSKTTQVFGESGKALEKWSKTTATGFGIASDQALEFASSFGALLRPLGVAQNEAAEQSRKLTERGADLASFYNTDVKDALDAIKSGVVGETEPLRRYGIILNENRIAAEAMASGLVKTKVSAELAGEANTKVAIAQARLTKAMKDHLPNSIAVATAQNALSAANRNLEKTLGGSIPKLTDQQKVMARISLIYKDSTIAAGDFDRTSDGLANKQRILHAQLRDVEIILGQALMPTILNVTTAVSDWLAKGENQERLTNDIKAAVEKMTEALKVAWAIVQLGTKAFGLLSDAVGGTGNAIKLLIALKVVTWFARLRREAILTQAVLIGTGGGGGGLAGSLKSISKTWPISVKLIGAAAVAAAAYALAKYIEDQFGVDSATKAAKLGRVQVGTGKKNERIFYDAETGKYSTSGAETHPGIGSHALVEVPIEVAAKQLGISVAELMKRATGAVKKAQAVIDRGISTPGGVGPAARSAPGGQLAGFIPHTGQTRSYGDRVSGPTAGLQAIQAVVGGNPSIDYSGHVKKSYHYSGQALDIGDGGVPASLIEDWNFLFPMRENLAQLIWAPPSRSVMGKAPGSGHGYFWGEVSDTANKTHTDHIHVAFTGSAEDAQKLIAWAGGKRGRPPTPPSGAGAKTPAPTTTPTPAVSTQVTGGKASVGIKTHKRGGADIPAGWAEQVLDGLDAPHTPGNIAFLQSWQKAEGGSSENTASFNPLCTTQTMPGSVSMNSVGVQAYTSWESGLEATIKTLLNGNYPAVVAALRSGGIGKSFKPTEDFAKQLRTWSGGGYGSISTGGTPQLGAGGGLVDDSGAKPPKTNILDLSGRQKLALSRMPGGSGGRAAEQTLLQIYLKRRTRKGLTADERADLNDAIHDIRDKIARADKEIADAAADAVKKGNQRIIAQLAAHPERAAGFASVMATRGSETLGPGVRTGINRAIKKVQAEIDAAAKEAARASNVLQTLMGMDQSAAIEIQDEFGRVSKVTIGEIVAHLTEIIRNLASSDPKVRAAARKAWAGYGPTISAAISAGNAQAADALAAGQAVFDTAFSRVSSRILTAFDRETSSHLAGMAAANQAAINSIQQAAQSQIASMQAAADHRIQQLQERLQARLKKLQQTLAKEIKKLEAIRSAPTSSEAALTALQQAHDEAAATKARAEAIQALADAQNAANASTPEGQRAIADAQAAVNEILYQDQVNLLQRQGENERRALDESTQAKIDKLTADEQAQEESLQKQEAAEEASIQARLASQIEAINAQTEAQVAAMNEAEAAREQDYQDERDGQRLLLEDELTQWGIALGNHSKTFEQFLVWLNGKTASGIFGLNLPKVNPVTLAASAGATAGNAFARNFISELQAIPPAIAQATAGVQPSIPRPSTPGNAFTGGTFGFQHGGIVPGLDLGYDSVAMRLQPGELILNKAQQRNLARQLGGGGGGTTIIVKAIHSYGATSRQVHEGLARGLRPYLGRVSTYRSPT